MGDSMPRPETEKCEHPFKEVESVPVEILVDGELYKEREGLKCMRCSTVLGTNR